MASKPYWGYMRSGGGTAKLLACSFSVGLVLALGLGALIAALGYPERFWLAWAIFACAFLMPFSLLGWLLLVDWDTLRSAPKNPELSVEYNWYEKAVVGAFHDLLLISGVGAAALSTLSITGALELKWPLHLMLAGLVLVLFSDVALRYLILKKKHG